MTFHPLYAFYGSLHVEPAYRAKGIYASILLTHSKWLKPLGCEAMVCNPASAHSEWVLMMGGFTWMEFDGQQFLGVKFVNGTGRVEEYRAWVAGGSKPEAEPVWHRELREAPVAGEELF